MTTLRIYLMPPDDSGCMAWSPAKFQTGLGGAEQSVVLLSQALALRGHEFRIFNNSGLDQQIHGVFYHPKQHFVPELLEPPDIFIFYRAPDPALTTRLRRMWPQTKLIGWSCDQATIGDYHRWLLSMDQTVTISSYHTQFFLDSYTDALDPPPITHIDLPVNISDYVPFDPAPRRNLFLWSSQAERGLDRVALAWPLLKRALPDAELYVTADRRLWGVDYRGNEPLYALLEGLDDVHVLGSIPRRELVALQRRAKLQLSSLTYPELFCISVAEAQAAGAIPVVGPMGALPTTVMAGQWVAGNPRTSAWFNAWIDAVLAHATAPQASTAQTSRAAHEAAVARFAPERIALQWESLFRQVMAGAPVYAATAESV